MEGLNIDKVHTIKRQYAVIIFGTLIIHWVLLDDELRPYKYTVIGDYIY